MALWNVKNWEIEVSGANSDVEEVEAADFTDSEDDVRGGNINEE